MSTGKTNYLCESPFITQNKRPLILFFCHLFCFTSLLLSAPVNSSAKYENKCTKAIPTISSFIPVFSSKCFLKSSASPFTGQDFCLGLYEMRWVAFSVAFYICSKLPVTLNLSYPFNKIDRRGYCKLGRRVELHYFRFSYSKCLQPGHR